MSEQAKSPLFESVLQIAENCQRAERLFWRIRSDWSDPRDACRLGVSICAEGVQKAEEILGEKVPELPEEEVEGW